MADLKFRIRNLREDQDKGGRDTKMINLHSRGSEVSRMRAAIAIDNEAINAYLNSMRTPLMLSRPGSPIFV